MFGFSSLWLIPVAIFAAVGAVIWHDGKVETIRSDAIRTERARVALVTAVVQQKAAAKAADIAAAGEREAAQHEVDMRAKDLELDAANAEIAKLEEKARCVVSRETVRVLNRSYEAKRANPGR